jgi:hypothetical protein
LVGKELGSSQNLFKSRGKDLGNFSSYASEILIGIKAVEAGEPDGMTMLGYRQQLCNFLL